MGQIDRTPLVGSIEKQWVSVCQDETVHIKYKKNYNVLAPRTNNVETLFLILMKCKMQKLTSEWMSETCGIVNAYIGLERFHEQSHLFMNIHICLWKVASFYEHTHEHIYLFMKSHIFSYSLGHIESNFFIRFLYVLTKWVYHITPLHRRMPRYQIMTHLMCETQFKIDPKLNLNLSIQISKEKIEVINS